MKSQTVAYVMIKYIVYHSPNTPDCDGDSLLFHMEDYDLKYF